MFVVVTEWYAFWACMHAIVHSILRIAARFICTQHIHSYNQIGFHNIFSIPITSLCLFVSSHLSILNWTSTPSKALNLPVNGSCAHLSMVSAANELCIWLLVHSNKKFLFFCINLLTVVFECVCYPLHTSHTLCFLVYSNGLSIYV